jgi:hypothetical protein
MGIDQGRKAPAVLGQEGYEVTVYVDPCEGRKSSTLPQFAYPEGLKNSSRCEERSCLM